MGYMMISADKEVVASDLYPRFEFDSQRHVVMCNPKWLPLPVASSCITGCQESH